MKYESTSSVGERGQITIGKEIRERLGIKPKDIAVERIENGRLVISFLPAPHMRSLAGVLGPPPRKPPRELDIDEAVGEAIAGEWEDYLTRERLDAPKGPLRGRAGRIPPK